MPLLGEKSGYLIFFASVGMTSKTQSVKIKVQNCGAAYYFALRASKYESRAFFVDCESWCVDRIAARHPFPGKEWHPVGI